VSKLLHVQWLRGLAALSVAALHAQHDAAGLAERLGAGFAPYDRVPWAAGVDAFFVISGFIMVHASRRFFEAPGAAGTFLARRAARIVPLYWAVTSLYLGVAFLASGLVNSAVLEPWPVAASYLFIPFARPDGSAQPVYSLGWTLNYEMFFYALFALTLAWPLRKAVPGLAALMAGLVLLGQLLPLPQPFGFWTDPIILEFVFGLALGLIRAEGIRLSGPVRAALVAAGLALLAMNLVPPDGPAGLARPLGWGLPVALLVAAAALGGDRPGPAPRILQLGAALGDASYALYLIHPFVIRALSELAARTDLGAMVGPWGYIFLALAGSVLVALAVHRWFERPLTELARRRLEPVRWPQWSSP
jgi:peptidoglycan/LPS O-acetylase OafA/YrhL